MSMKVKEKGFFLLAGLLIGLLVLFLNEMGLFERLELMTVDLRFMVNKEKRYQGDEVVIIAIRPEDTEELGSFPWPRSYYARVIDRLRKGGAKVICFDLFFPSPRSLEDDLALIEATRRAGNVLYPVFYPQSLREEMFKGGPVFVPELTENIPELAKAAAGQGHINLKVGVDGKVRGFPFALSYEERDFPALGLLSFLKYKDIPGKEVRQEGNFLYAGNYRIPLDEGGNILIKNFGLLGEIPWFRFAKVKEGRIPEKLFQGKIVIIGYAISGVADTDIYSTPRERQFGITIIASLINTILRQDFLQHLPLRTRGFTLLPLSIFCILIMTGMNFRRSTLLAAGLIITAGGLSIYLFEKPGIVLEVVPLLTIILSNYTLATVVVSRKADLTIREGERRLRMFQEMARTTTSSLGEEGSLDLIVSRIAQAVRAELCILRELDKETGTLKLAATYGLEKDIKNPALLESDLRVAEEAIASPEPLLMRGRGGPSSSNKASLMCSTLSIKDEVIGTISVSGRVAPVSRKALFTPEDADLFATLSDEATVAVKNAQLHREVQKLFLESIASLAATIDAKDPYTEHHSERVVIYSLAIAEELGFSREDKETVRLAAILHDIGKVGVPESVLKKPGRLTVEEYTEMKLHPLKGARIMEHIDQLQPIIPGMRYHHERYDGKGYPDGLIGENIPFVGRIIAVADTYDAMTSARPYRGACAPEYACREIEKNMGTQFDPRTAEAFLSAFSKGKIILPAVGSSK